SLNFRKLPHAQGGCKGNRERWVASDFRGYQPRQSPCKARSPAFRRKFVLCICTEYELPPEGRTTNIAFSQARLLLRVFSARLSVKQPNLLLSSEHSIGAGGQNDILVGTLRLQAPLTL